MPEFLIMTANMLRRMDNKRRIAPAALFTLSLLLLTAVVAGCGGSGVSFTPPNGMWVANAYDVEEFNFDAQGGLPTGPQVSLRSPAFGAPLGVAFDQARNLWVTDAGTSTSKPALYQFTSTQLNALHSNNAPMPTTIINSNVFRSPEQAAFDSHGDLWVSDNQANAVYMFTPAQLAAGGTNVTPAATIISSPAFSGPIGIVFGASGDLFVANNNSTTLFKFSAGTLPATGASGPLSPSATLSDDGNGSIQAPWGLVLDGAGNLLTSNSKSPFTLVKFPLAALTTSGSPVPALTIAPITVNGVSTLISPTGIAFDSAGNLAAVNSASPFGTSIFPAQDVARAGAFAFLPKLTAVSPSTPAGITFGPVIN